MGILKVKNRWYIQIMHKGIIYTAQKGFETETDAFIFNEDFKENLKNFKGKTYKIPLHKKLCLEYYSNGKMKCVCCGEKHPAFLTLDHVDGGGYKHRKNIGAGSQLYRYLIKNNFPKEIKLQVLCWNCNCGKKINHGICPHKNTIRWVALPDQ